MVLALDDDDLEEAAVLARRATEGQVEPLTWRTRNRLAAAQQIVAELRAEGSADRDAIIARLRRAACVSELEDTEWAALVDYLIALHLARESDRRLGPGRGTLQRFYASLSLIPDERTYRLRDIATRRLIGTLDERFVLTQILAQPEEIFLLHGRTWKVVEHREGELLVEGVQELGQEPRWVGEDIPVPFDVAQEIGESRRTGSFDPYPISPVDRQRLERRRSEAIATGSLATDRRVTISARARLVVFGACFGTRTNETLALAVAGVLTSRLGARVELASVEPTWFVLELPIALDDPALVDAFRLEPADLRPLVERLVPSGFDYRWVFLNVARKLGVLPTSSDPRDLRTLDPLLQASQTSPLGEEALEKTLHDRYDIDHAVEVLRRVRSGAIEVVASAPSALTDGPLERLRWRAVPDVPPPTLLKAIRERLENEALTLVCLRCGFVRTTTARSLPGGRREPLPPLPRRPVGRSLTAARGRHRAVVPLREEAPTRATRVPPTGRARRERPLGTDTEALVRSGYTSAELLAHHGERALLALAARGVGPETARRLLARLYRNDDAFFTEILRAERAYARTRAFWD